MKYRFLFITCLLFLVTALIAQTSINIPVELKWKGVERWYADSLYVDVLTFEGSQQRNDNLPYYHYTTSIDPIYSYKAELKNPVYIQATNEDIHFLQNKELSGQPEIETYISSSRDEKSFHVSVFPFIRQADQTLKLKSFDLVVEKSLQTSKTAKASTIHRYADKSVLSQGRFVKVRITESGVYKLTYSDLRKKDIEPSNIRMFGYGGGLLDENFSKPKYDDLPEIAVYDTGDAILFYAQGVNKWTYNATKDMFTHTLNHYSNYGYYFVTSDNVGEKKRVKLKSEVDPGSVIPLDVEEFTDYKVHEKELEARIKSGRELYGEKFANASSLNLSFNFPNAIKTSSSLKTNLNTIKGTFYLNQVSGESDNIIFRLSFSGAETGHLNYLEVNAQRQLKMTNSVMTFHNKLNIGATSYNRYLLDTNNTNIQIWDITDQLNVQQIPTTRANGKLIFTDLASTVKSYLAIHPAAVSEIPSATLLDEVPRQNIHGMEPVDMLIITHPMFVKAAEELAQAHYEINDLRVGVVTTEQVYNEFSSGTPDASAYRWAVKMFYDKPQNDDDKIRYLLLFGNGLFDNRNILLLSKTNKNLVLTYQSVNSWDENESYVTDDYFGLLDDSEGSKIESSDRVDIGIGRFPVVTEEEAHGVVNKTIKYMRNENNGGWKNQLCFLGDDGDDNGHMRDINTIADAVTKISPSHHSTKILFDAYQQEVNASGESYPGAKNQFHNLIRSGLFFIAYMGHANTNGWANESMLTYNDTKNLRNKNLPLFSAGTCEFSRFDKEVVSTGEEIVRNSQGGGIGCFSATRVVYMSSNYTLLKHFCDTLFKLKNEHETAIGDIVRKTKNVTTDNHKNNRLKYIYFGDPAVRLKFPKHTVSVDTINNISIQEKKDTLRALSVNTVKGSLRDINGQKIVDFNGNLQVIILDKKENMKTLANDADSTPFEYTDRPNTLFRGITTVKNGEFEFTFMLPKDIKYNYGTGRMVFYAWDDDHKYEAHGHCEDFIIGGSKNNVESVYTGPVINMYLNHERFVSGEKVNQTPVFVAHVQDNNGISISSPTPGHDMMLVVGNNYSYVLNDYYETKQDTYKEGTVNFQMPELPEGNYTLMFRVWNLFNVSSVEYLDFEVVKDLSPEIFSVSCYPNPAISQTDIIVQHDREDEILSMTVDVYDLSGRRVWSRTQEDSNIIHWDLVKDTGEKVSSGMYVYRVSIKDGKKIISSKANKIIVKN